MAKGNDNTHPRAKINSLYDYLSVLSDRPDDNSSPEDLRDVLSFLETQIISIPEYIEIASLKANSGDLSSQEGQSMLWLMNTLGSLLRFCNTHHERLQMRLMEVRS